MKEKQRIYFVVDMKSFFASVECAERGLDAMTTKLVVADEGRSKGTVCLAVSPAMKKLGVRNRCRLYEIPNDIDYIIAPPRMKKYIEYAGEIYGIYLKYIDKSDIHVYSIDECFLDVTDYLKIYNLSPKDFAIKLMNEILEKVHIPSSVGIGTNMYLAKIALDITAKHNRDRIGWLTEDLYKKTLWKHRPITDFWQISTGIEKRLNKYGIFDMEGIANCKEDILYNEFGINAELLIDHAYGKESCLLSDIKSYTSKEKSISSSQILPCNYNFKDAKLVMREMIQSGCYNLFNQNYVTNHLKIYVSYGDVKDKADKGMTRMNVTTNLYSIIGEYADKLFDSVADKNRPIRKLGYEFGYLLPSEYEQYDFFTDLGKIEKEKKRVKSILELQNKFGKNSLLKGLDLEKNATQIERNKTIGGHKSGED
ncbi:MAG: DNA repair protein [Clostridia bacterium]|nr:DNA repair protein [Clostridia bacterium]